MRQRRDRRVRLFQEMGTGIRGAHLQCGNLEFLQLRYGNGGLCRWENARARGSALDLGQYVAGPGEAFDERLQELPVEAQLAGIG